MTDTPSVRGLRISIDRGGTFTDAFASVPGREDIVVKLLSVDPNHYKDAPREAVRRILEIAHGQDIPRRDKINTSSIEHIRLSTTVATNALLERQGERHALITTKGFRDLLKIGNQSRPAIFDLAIRKPDVLYSEVYEVDERVTLVGFTSDPKHSDHQVHFNEDGSIKRAYQGPDKPPPSEDPGSEGQDAPIVKGVSGEAVAIIKRPDRNVLKRDLQRLYDAGFNALGVVLIHSFTFPDHEKIVEEVAREIGFKHISLSSQLMPMIKAVPRGTSTTADAYLTPVLHAYIDSFFSGFDDSLRDGTAGTKVEFMMSDGGLTSVEHFSGLKSIISGPAGGVVGMALTSYDEKDGRPVLGLDMGGTSTDVPRFAGHYEQVFETTISGVTIQSPQLDVNTVASGGSSRLFFRNGLFVVGPESASAHPGPTCYRKGGPLAITDANVVTGHLAVERFPKIFGPNEDEGLDVDASREAFEKLTQDINNQTGKSMSVDEVAQGFIRIANETMCRPIRALTEARGYSASKHILSCFGGAGGQHACSLARSLGITTVFIHRYSSILSAYGMALADRVFERQEPSSVRWGEDGCAETVDSRARTLETQVREELHRQGFTDEHLRIESMLNMRYDGTDTALMTLKPQDGWQAVEQSFIDTYKTEFGFTLDKPIVVDDVRVKGIGKSYQAFGESVHAEHARLAQENGGFKTAEALRGAETKSVYFDVGGRVDTPILPLDQLRAGEKVTGPAILIDGTQTITLEPKCEARICSSCVVIEVGYD
ncbi:unnamed protein product [Parajaminaea phylloscopi]